MEKRRVFALILIGLVVVSLLKTSGSCDVNLLLSEIKASTSMALLSFTAMGVFIGLLLR